MTGTSAVGTATRDTPWRLSTITHLQQRTTMTGNACGSTGGRGTTVRTAWGCTWTRRHVAAGRHVAGRHAAGRVLPGPRRRATSFGCCSAARLRRTGADVRSTTCGGGASCWS